jgi:hypothetical protein
MTDDKSQMKIHEAIRLDLSPVICHLSLGLCTPSGPPPKVLE